MSDSDRNEEIYKMMDDNIDILRKATGRVSSLNISYWDVFSEVFIRLQKHLKLDKIADTKMFRMYLAKTAYHVTSAMIKSGSPATSIIAGGTSGSVRRLNHEELVASQENLWNSIVEKYSSASINSEEQWGRSFEDDIDFENDIKEVLEGDSLTVANLLAQGYIISEISRMTGIKASKIRLKLVPKIKTAMIRMQGNR